MLTKLRLFLIIFGLLLILVGAYGLLAQSPFSPIINVAFLVFGMVTQLFQIFFHFPVFEDKTALKQSLPSASISTVPSYSQINHYTSETPLGNIKPPGTLKWSFSVSSYIGTSLAVASGTVYFGSYDHKLCYVLRQQWSMALFISAQMITSSMPLMLFLAMKNGPFSLVVRYDLRQQWSMALFILVHMITNSTPLMLFQERKSGLFSLVMWCTHHQQ